MLDDAGKSNAGRDCEIPASLGHVIQEVETAVRPVANISE
jgi:hypothetical protein